MIPILYGSQTGNAIFLAKLLEKCVDNSFSIPIDMFNRDKINDFPLVIFICSTHGDGQCPFNMAKFYNFIISKNTKIFTFKSAVLGLGDSSYPKFNYCARILVEKLNILGSEVILKDFCNLQDLNGMYDGFNTFKTGLLKYLVDEYLPNNPKKQTDELSGKNNSNRLIKSFKSEKLAGQIDCDRLSYRPNRSDELNEANKSSRDNTVTSNFVEGLKNTQFAREAKVISNKLVTPTDYQNPVYEMVLSIPGYSGFIPGDCISILPQNSNSFEKYFNFSDQQIKFLRESVDFYSIVYQPTFVQLADYTDSSVYKKKIMEISEDYDLYHSYILQPKRNILEVIQDFSLNVPFEFFKDYNRIYPRYFSCSFINGKYHILYNIVEYNTYLKEKREGICSKYMKSLEIGISIQVEIIKSNLFLNDKKLLFFSTGTGVTLPRSVIHHFLDKEIVVFYGFRYYSKDQLCFDEFNDNRIVQVDNNNKHDIRKVESKSFNNRHYFQNVDNSKNEAISDPENGISLMHAGNQSVKIHYASSRDDKKYIMDLYREHPVEDIDQWLVFVSGNSRLNKEIKKLLKDIHGRDVVFQSETW